MSKPPRLELSLWECQGIQEHSDVVQVVRRIADLGFPPGVGAWTREGGTPQPVVDIEAHLDKVHTVSPAGERAARGGQISPLTQAESWLTAVVNREHPQAYAALSLSRLGEQMWNLFLLIGCSPRDRAGLSDRDFSAWACDLLDRLGGALYEQVQPALSSITSRSADGSELAQAVLRRRLIVGWRTWFGPAYVDAFGRDRLLGLPDRAQPLADGGVAHCLAAPPVALVEADLSIYDEVWPYLAQHGITPTWPVPPRSRAQRSEGHADRALAEFRRELYDRLTFTIVLDDRQRVKVLTPDWSTLADPRLGEPKRALLLQSVRDAAERELGEHPDARIRFEVGQGAPEELQRLLNHLTQANSRLSYVILPGQN